MKETVKMIMDALSFDFKCPNTENYSSCTKEKTLQLTAITHNSMRFMLGGSNDKIKIRIAINHDVGKSCFEITLKLNNVPKRSG
jgi:hypothetical protein